jgi:hypothetical protein
MSTGRLFYTDLAEMIASHRERGKQAAIHEIQVMYKNPYDASEKAPEKRRLYDMIADTYAHKDGIADPATHKGAMPGGTVNVGGWRGKTYLEPGKDPYGVPYRGGRADVRLSMGGDGEIYALSKTDGMIRILAAVVTPPPAASRQVASK